MESQTKLIKEHLLNGEAITPLEALRKYDYFRLGARIHDLKSEGMNIKTEMRKNGKKRFAEYSLA